MLARSPRRNSLMLIISPDAKIKKRERIAFIVNHEASTKTPAVAIRLAAW